MDARNDILVDIWMYLRRTTTYDPVSVCITVEFFIREINEIQQNKTKVNVIKTNLYEMDFWWDIDDNVMKWC